MFVFLNIHIDTNVWVNSWLSSQTACFLVCLVWFDSRDNSHRTALAGSALTVDQTDLELTEIYPPLLRIATHMETVDYPAWFRFHSVWNTQDIDRKGALALFWFDLRRGASVVHSTSDGAGNSEPLLNLHSNAACLDSCCGFMCAAMLTHREDIRVLPDLRLLQCLYLFCDGPRALIGCLIVNTTQCHAYAYDSVHVSTVYSGQCRWKYIFFR